ncbi:MAG: hypothetical protein DCF28_06620, partial [Alphaproteobacteria bacterium]
FTALLRVEGPGLAIVLRSTALLTRLAAIDLLLLLVLVLGEGGAGLAHQRGHQRRDRDGHHQGTFHFLASTHTRDGRLVFTITSGT